jgi:type III restriction enzyme
VKEDGLAAFYSPDFLVRTKDAVYLVETKAQKDVTSPNVQRKLKAAQTWCERISQLPPEHRDERPWHYVLLGESVFREWTEKGGGMAEMLGFARVRAVTTVKAQGVLL